jgi:hypothetical protein
VRFGSPNVSENGLGDTAVALIGSVSERSRILIGGVGRSSMSIDPVTASYSGSRQSIDLVCRSDVVRRQRCSWLLDLTQ